MFNYRIFNNQNDLFDLADRIFNSSELDNNIHTEYPYIQLYEEDTRYIIKAALPGLKKEDVNIEINNNLLTIEGEKKSDYSEGSYLRKERTFGKFKKTVKFGEGIDHEKVNADLKDGILTIELPKSQKAAIRKIEVR
jgi:HSP20 family protein